MKTDAGQDVRRVLDEGVVISGDVQVKLLGVKVLPIKVNLLIGSPALAESLGVNWWPARRRGGKRSPPPAPATPPARNKNVGARRPQRNGDGGG